MPGFICEIAPELFGHDRIINGDVARPSTSKPTVYLFGSSGMATESSIEEICRSGPAQTPDVLPMRPDRFVEISEEPAAYIRQATK